MSPKTPLGRAILDLMADGKARFVREIAAASGVGHEAVRHACARLIGRGMLDKTFVDGVGIYTLSETGRARLASDPANALSAKGRRVEHFRGSLRARAWRLMDMQPWWSVGELLMTVADGDEKGAAENLTRYVRALRVAGYVVESRREAGRYHLTRPTGRLAPALNTQTGTLTDPNTGEVHDVRG